jgi:hypothetical protein
VCGYLGWFVIGSAPIADCNSSRTGNEASTPFS